MATRDWNELLAQFKELIELSGKSLRRVATEVGVSHTALQKVLDGRTSEPHSPTQGLIERWCSQEEDRQERLPVAGIFQSSGSHADEDVGVTLVLDPNTARRALMAVGPEDWKTRRAIILVFEEAYIEAGYSPDRWPRWFQELRTEVYGKA